MVRHGLLVADGVSVPYRQLVDSTLQDLSALKRSREGWRQSSRRERRAKRARGRRPPSRAANGTVARVNEVEAQMSTEQASPVCCGERRQQSLT